jgi:hypothetical protein
MVNITGVDTVMGPWCTSLSHTLLGPPFYAVHSISSPRPLLLQVTLSMKRVAMLVGALGHGVPELPPDYG